MEVKIIPINLGFVKSFIVKSEKTILVDAGLKGSSGKILKVMEANGIKPADVSLILITHAHMDHAGGLKGLKDVIPAPVAVHALEAGFLSEGKGAPVNVRSGFMRIISVFTKRARLAGVRPEILIEGQFDLKPYGVEGYIFPTPGHTMGSLTLVTKSGDAVVGDMVGGMKGMPAIPGIYTDMDAIKASIAGLAGHSISKVYTSHAGVYAIGDVLKLGK